jgi:hypothetical protein
MLRGRMIGSGPIATPQPEQNCPMLTYRKNGEDYEVKDGDRTIGFVMKFYPGSRIRRGRASVCPRWGARDMEENTQTFWTRAEAGKWLLSVATS